MKFKKIAFFFFKLYLICLIVCNQGNLKEERVLSYRHAVLTYSWPN